MVVQSSNIGMRSERYYRKREEEVKSLQLWGTSKNGQDELQMGNALKEGGVDAKEIAEAKNTVKSSRNIQKQEGSELKKSIHQIQAEAIQYLLDLFFGDGKGKHTALDMLGQTMHRHLEEAIRRSAIIQKRRQLPFRQKERLKPRMAGKCRFRSKWKCPALLLLIWKKEWILVQQGCAIL